MNKPNFIIIGAMKAGTSFLNQLLTQHPEIFLAKQELNFFSNESNYRKGLTSYLEHFSNASGYRAIGEKSPNYYVYVGAEERMARDLGNIKLIWVFRNPVKRAYSDYWFSIYRGRELKSFDKAVSLELAGKRSDIYRHYLWRSTYIRQIERYTKFFSLTNMHFILLESLQKNPKQEIQRAFRFLEVASDFEVDIKPEFENPTALPRYFWLNYVANRLFAKSARPIFNIIRKYNSSNITGYPEMSADTKLLLYEYFRPFNEELSSVIKQDLDSWKEPKESSAL